LIVVIASTADSESSVTHDTTGAAGNSAMESRPSSILDGSDWI
jgi:hypothetical protein